MNANNVLGIIYSNAYDPTVPELTNARTMGSIPFAGRYRLIDFPLSNMVNCGINKIGVITKSNYQSLMDHVGSGKSWDLSRKREGLFILPPFNDEENGFYRDRIHALQGIMRFIRQSKEEYVMLSDSNAAFNFDMSEMLKAHTDNNADMTIAYCTGKLPNLKDLMVFDVDETQKVNEITFDTAADGDVNYSLNIVLMRKSLLERLINDAVSLNLKSFERDIIQANVEKLNIFGFKVPGFAGVFDSLKSYYDISLSLLNPENCRSLFPRERPVYTKVRDEVPASYGLNSSVKNSLIADGCIIEGEVENCILFRGVRIAKGAVVKNSIIMQGSYISEDAHIENIIMDKSVVVRPRMSMSGAQTFPIYVGKGIII